MHSVPTPTTMCHALFRPKYWSGHGLTGRSASYAPAVVLRDCMASVFSAVQYTSMEVYTGVYTTYALYSVTLYIIMCDVIYHHGI